MTKVKYVPFLFAFYDRTGIQSFLEKQARAGWHPEKLGNYFWKFSRGEAKQVHYSVTYQGKFEPDDPAADARNQVFAEFCTVSGWELAADNARMQIYRSELPEPIPIETDAALEVENIHLAAKKGFLPECVMNLFAALLLLASFCGQLIDIPLDILTGDGIILYAFCLALMLAIALVKLLGYFLWYRKARRAAQLDGSFVPTNGSRMLQILTTVLACCVVLLLLSSGWQIALVILVIFAMALVGVTLITRNSQRMKEQEYPTFENRTYTVILSVLLIVAVAITTFLLLSLVEPGAPDSYEAPLHLHDLVGGSESHENCSATVESSLLVSQATVGCGPEDGRLAYHVVDVKIPLVYGTALRYYQQMYTDPIYAKLFGEEFDPTFREVDPSPWSAESAYYLYWERLGGHMYILCYDSRIVYISYPQPLTPEQMQTVGAILGT